VPHFYFHLRDELGFHPDDVGLDFPDVETSYLEAFRAAVGLWGELLQQRRDPRCSRFEITDARGEPLFELPFSEVPDSMSRPAARLRLKSAVTAQGRAEHMMALTQSLQDEIKLACQRVRDARDLLEGSPVQR
jgi:hypothetical protein